MYESYYNLTGKPFPLHPDPRFFFPSSSHKRAMSYLQYGVEQGEGFIVITGDIGTGKSTLVQYLFDRLDRKRLVAAQLVTTQLGTDDLLRMIASVFHLQHEGLSKAGLLNQLEEFLVSCAREGRRVLLVVDEVQNIPRESLEELRMLSNFNSAGHAVLQTFLLGQKEFNETLNAPDMVQLKQRVIASYQLRALDREESQQYIEHRLNLVGWQGNPSFADDAHDLIFEMTAGIPRRINMLCDRLLLYCYLEEVREIARQVVRDVIDELGEEVVREDSGGVGTGLLVDNMDIPAQGMEICLRRLASLEQRVSELEDALQLERARLRALTLNSRENKN